MLAPKFVEANETLRMDRERELTAHHKKMQAILRRKRRGGSLPVKRKATPGNGGFLGSARQADIMRENKALFERLLAISQGKWTLFPGDMSRLSPKSLNIANRQRAVEKITQENSLLASRIVQKSSFLSTKQLLKDYSDVQRYKRHISKAYLFGEGSRRSKLGVRTFRKETRGDRVTDSQSLSVPMKEMTEESLSMDKSQDPSQTQS